MKFSNPSRGNDRSRYATKTSVLNWNISVRTMMKIRKWNHDLYASKKPPRFSARGGDRLQRCPKSVRGRVERNSVGRRPLGLGADNNRSQGINIPSLLATHLGRSENDLTSCVTTFVRWIEDYPLLDGLKMPSHVDSYDGKGDPDNYLYLFEKAIVQTIMSHLWPLISTYCFFGSPSQPLVLLEIGEIAKLAIYLEWGDSGEGEGCLSMWFCLVLQGKEWVNTRDVVLGFEKGEKIGYKQNRGRFG
ncbi:hypothetical protein Tco_0500093 [Tanacetum coccineum]